MEIDGVNISVDNITQDLLQLLVGERWPNGDEGAMRQLASTWNDAATQLEQIQQAASAAAKGVGQYLQGSSADAFASFWSTNFDDGKTSWPAGAAPAALPFAVQFCKTMANALNSGATQIETTKDTIMGNIAILVATVAPQIAAGFFDFGATDATAISEILADKIAMKLTLDVAEKAILEIVLGAIEQGLMQAELNFIIQFKEVAEGHASGINWAEVGTSGLSGVAGGLLGGAFGAGIGKGIGKAAGSDLGKAIGDSLGMDTGKDFGKNIADSFVGKTLTGVASGGLTNATMDLAQNGKISASDFTNGSLGAVAGSVGEHFKGQGDTPAMDTANLPDPAAVSIPNVSDHTNLSGISMPTTTDHGILGGTAGGDGLLPAPAPSGGDPGMSTINPSQMEGMVAAPTSSIARLLGGGGATEDAGAGGGGSTGSATDSIGLSANTSSGGFGGGAGGTATSGGSAHDFTSGSSPESGSGGAGTAADPFGSTGSSGLGSIGSMGADDSAGGGVTSGGSLGTGSGAGGGGDTGISAGAGTGTGSGVSAGAGLDTGGSGPIASVRADVGGPSASGLGSTGAGAGGGASFGAASRADAGLTGGSDASASGSGSGASQYSSTPSGDPPSAGSGGGVGAVGAVGFVPMGGERVGASAGESVSAGSGDGLSATGGDNFTSAAGEGGTSAGADTAAPLAGEGAAPVSGDASPAVGAEGAAMPEGAGAIPSAGLGAADAGVLGGGSTGRTSAGSGLGDGGATGARPDAPSTGSSTGSATGDGLGIGLGTGKSSGGRFYGGGRDNALGADHVSFGRENGLGASTKDPGDLGGWIGKSADSVSPALDKPLDETVTDPKAPEEGAPAPALGDIGDLAKPGAQDHPLDPAGDPNAAQDHPAEPGADPSGQDHPAEPGDTAPNPDRPGEDLTKPLDEATAPLDPGAVTHAPDEPTPEPTPDPAATDTAGATDGTGPFTPTEPRPDEGSPLGSTPFDANNGSTPDNRPPENQPPAEQTQPVEPIQPDQFTPAPADAPARTPGADGVTPRPDDTAAPRPDTATPGTEKAAPDRPGYEPDGLKPGLDAPARETPKPEATPDTSRQDPSTAEDPENVALVQQHTLDGTGTAHSDDPGVPGRDTSPAGSSDAGSWAPHHEELTGELAEMSARADVFERGMSNYMDHEMTDLARKVMPDAEGRFTVDMHGDPQGVYSGYTRPGADGLVRVMDANGREQGQAIRDLSCFAGAGDDPFAAKLARAADAPVLAADTEVWSDRAGNLFASKGHRDADGRWAPDIPPNGKWFEFSPDGTKREVGGDGFPPGEEVGFGNWHGPLEDVRSRGGGGDSSEPDEVTQAKLEELRGEWPELEHVLAGHPVTRDHLLEHPDSVKMLDGALRDVQGRLDAAGITDAVRSGEITPEVQAKINEILDHFNKSYPNEKLARPEQVAISDEIKSGTTEDGYRQLGFDLSRREETAYQEECVDRLRAEAPAAQEKLNRVVSDIARENGGDATFRPEPKDRVRSLEKVQENVDKYEDGDASMLVDVVGAEVHFDSVDELYRALGGLKDDPRLDIVRIKDRVAKAADSGNRSILMNVRMPDGHVAEVKYCLKSYHEPSAAEHPVYEVRRDLDANAVAEARPLSPVESLIKAAADAHARAEYGAVWNREMAGSRLHELLPEHADIASIARRLVMDSGAHPTNVAKALADPGTRDATIKTIGELADGQALGGRKLQDYLTDNAGAGPLFEPVEPSVNTTADGQDRKAVFLDESKQIDPAREVGAEPTDEQRASLDDYAKRLSEDVQPSVEAEVRRIADQVGNGASVSVRTKSAEGILDKVERMTEGSPGRPGRPDYRAGDVIDAVGARITVDSMDDLSHVLEAVKSSFGVGDDGRILEIENMYASPKSKNPAYRVIPLVVKTEVDGRPYTFELQLTTRRASIAADLEHNTVFKPYIDMSDTEKASVKQMLAEAAALDQEETQ